MAEARITINGTELTEHQSRTVRLALNALDLALSAETFGGGRKGREKWLTYTRSLTQIHHLMADSQNEVSV